MNRLLTQPKLYASAERSDRLAIESAYLNGDELEISLYGVVGDPYDEADALTITKLLSQHKDKSLRLLVNSPGGLAYDGVAIFNAIKMHQQPSTGVITGMAGSAASLAVVACDRVMCHEGAVFHPHYSLIMAYGHQAEIRDALAIQERLDLDLEQMYSSVSGRTITQVKNDLQGPNGDGTRFSAAEAMAAGYVHEVIPLKKVRQAAAMERRSTVRHRVALAKLRKPQ